jgi:alpha-D-xyloside xylohydrolase
MSFSVADRSVLAQPAALRGSDGLYGGDFGVTGARKSTALLLCAFALGQSGCGEKEPQRVVKEADGIIVTPKSGAAKRIRLIALADRIIRVTAVPNDSFDVPPSLMVDATMPAPATFTVETTDKVARIKTAEVIAEVALDSGLISFKDLQGTPLLVESKRELTPLKVDGQDFYAIHQQFNPGTDEAFYGLGQHQNAQMNYNGEDVELAQHNMDIAVPFVLSNHNYGVLWDNTSVTRFGNPKPYGLASRDLTITDANGKAGGFTATYAIKGEVKLTRVEPDINYQFIRDMPRWPPALLSGTHSNATGMSTIAPNQTVKWEGKLESSKTGMHAFQLYASSYFKLYADDKLVLDGWRQNWNPWYHNFKLPMTAGTPVAIRVEWTPDDGYIALLHNDPLPDAERRSLSLASEVAKSIDYYFVRGGNADEVIAGYRALTGKAVMLPRWAYGFWQSRQRYQTQDELLGVAREYRKRGLPLDAIVQDWFYWPEDAWGSHDFDASRYPDPKAMVDALHKDNVHFMISVWAKFYPTTDNYRALDAKGFMYRKNVELGTKDWVGPGYLNSHFDPYAPEAREMFWHQIETKLKPIGVDGWWLDNTEPDIHSNLDRASLLERMGPTALGPAAQYFNTYALKVSQAVYEGERKSATPDKRVYILTRSGTAGLQRYAASTWSGDVAARWDDLYRQIAAGANMSMSGLPNWTFDIGGFAVESRYLKPLPKDLAEWRELNLRWFQFGTFAPIFRSHGEAPLREIWNIAPPGHEVYESLAAYDRLRYRLMPYIYTLAAGTYHHDGTIMRGLVMDFPNDPKALDVNDQYMFGPAFLVNPVHEYAARSRKVYLPAGARWYDFHSGEVHDGGKEIDAAAPLARMPLFVRAGSIVPIGAAIQYTNERPDAPITLYVYQGANGAFELYEDDGVTYGYERGAFATIPLKYDDATGTLTIGARSGTYPGMPEKRTFNVRWIAPGEADAANLDAPADVSLEYSGQLIRFTRESAR